MPHYPIGIWNVIKKGPFKIDMKSIVKIKDNHTGHDVAYPILQILQVRVVLRACSF